MTIGLVYAMPGEIETLLTDETRTPIRTEADIDLYLQSLKAELMQYIGGDSDIIIK